MNTNTSRPAPIERAVASANHIDEELRRYDEHLCDVHGLTSGTQRYRASDTLIDFLKTL